MGAPVALWLTIYAPRLGEERGIVLYNANPAEPDQLVPVGATSFFEGRYAARQQEVGNAEPS